MSMSLLAAERSTSRVGARWADYFELCKPRIAVMVLIAVAVAYCLGSWGQPQPWTLVHLLFGTFLVAGSASAFNQWLERDLDCLMRRTEDRPLPAGRVTSFAAVMFGSVTLFVGVSYLLLLVSIASALWAVATWISYVVIYTPSKTRTSANTAIGAVAGALPVMIGWSAAGTGYDVRAASLFLLLFLWQFPHFMAIAWLYREQYGRAGMKMLPVVESTGARAGVQAVWAALALIPVSVIPALFAPGPGAAVYALVSLVLGLAQLGLAIQFCAWRSNGSARNLLRASLIYLPIVLVMLVLIPWI